MSRGFANPLTELAEFEELQRSLAKKQGPVQVSGCLDSQKVHLMQETMADRPWKLVVTYDDARAREIYDDFGCFRDNVWLYPAKDLLFYTKIARTNCMICFHTNCTAQSGKNRAICSISAAWGIFYNKGNAEKELGGIPC